MLTSILNDIIKDLETAVPISCKGYIADDVNGVLEFYKNGRCLKGGISDSMGNYFYIKKSGKHPFKPSNDDSCNNSMKAATTFDLVAVSSQKQNIALSFLNEMMRLGGYSHEVISNAKIQVKELDENYDDIFMHENNTKLKKRKNIIKIKFELSYRFNSIDTQICDLNLCEC